jgi:tetratricopeptide (TPR) repeat protein
MRLSSLALAVFASLLIVAGCASIGVPATSDPAMKLRHAVDLFDKQDRPALAERLIREAIDIYSTPTDQLGLAEAYRTYGLFFRSASVSGKWSNFYRSNGFLDRTACWDCRYAKSIEYFEKARTIDTDQQRFDGLTNVNLHMGFSDELMGNSEAATTYEEFLAPHRSRVGCTS